MRAILFWLAAWGVFLSFPTTRTFAAYITHSTAGVLINDGFEGDTAGSLPTGWSFDTNPSGLGVTSADLDVETGGPTPKPPAAHEGSKFLALRSAQHGAYQTFGPFSTGTMTARFAFYLGPTSTDATVFATFLKSPGIGLGKAAEWFGFADRTYMNTYDGTSIAAGFGGVDYYAGTGPGSGGFAGEYALKAGGVPFTFTLGAWHEVTMTYDIAASAIVGGSTTAMTIIVDGTTLDALPAKNTLAGSSVTGFQVLQNGSQPGFFDAALPEPASMGVLAIALLLAARRNRHAPI